MKPPLTREQLIEIRDRNRGHADVAALLWEVKRMRALLLRSHDYLRVTPTSSTAQMIAEGLRRDLDDEPIVKEQPSL